MGVPQNGWFISWEIPLKWMMTGGTPIFGKPPKGEFKELYTSHSH